tara:strand:- start:195 stop:374 length:180 start_codon:yes stop_codon:yes gene_type:complete
MTDLINPSEIEPINHSSLNRRLKKLEFKIAANDQITRIEYLEQLVTSMINKFSSETVNK